MLKILKYFDIE